MEKEYNLPEENNGNKVEEPALGYGMETEILPTITEEELKNCINGEEFTEYWCKCIDKAFDK